MVSRICVIGSLLAYTSAASAWTLTPSPICTLSHSTESAEISITYDPLLDLPYALTATRSAPWPEGSVFSIHFQGPSGFTISTNRHKLMRDGLTLKVEDTGFGNVLKGLEFNINAMAKVGAEVEVFPLDGIGPAIEAFRACPEALTS